MILLACTAGLCGGPSRPSKFTETYCLKDEVGVLDSLSKMNNSKISMRLIACDTNVCFLEEINKDDRSYVSQYTGHLIAFIHPHIIVISCDVNM